MILSGEPLNHKGLLLLVDDEEIVLDVGSQMLDKIGYSVFKAKNGKEAIAIFREHKAQVNPEEFTYLQPILHPQLSIQLSAIIYKSSPTDLA